MANKNNKPNMKNIVIKIDQDSDTIKFAILYNKVDINRDCKAIIEERKEDIINAILQNINFDILYMSDEELKQNGIIIPKPENLN